MKFLVIFSFFFASTAFAVDDYYAYYGADFYELYEAAEDGGPVKLRKELHRVLTSYHRESVVGGFDDIVRLCNEESPLCYRHDYHTYDNAREYMFGFLDLMKDSRNKYYVKDVYCNKRFKEDVGVGPGLIPDYEKISAEHTWPQSVFDNDREVKTEDKDVPEFNIKKSDLHALFPSQYEANSNVRANNPFGNVETLEKKSCNASRKGLSESDLTLSVFEPPDRHKGNVARAMFYFATRYDLNIEEFEEDVLREWHELDPVDDAEFDRMEAIFEFQLTRNPFIDHPELVDFISNF